MTSFKLRPVSSCAIVLFLTLAFIQGRAADTLSVCSPSGKICVKVWMDRQLSYAVSYKGKSIVAPSSIDLHVLGNPSLSSHKVFKSHSLKKVNEQIISPVPEKRRIIPDVYNQLSVVFKQSYKVEFRAYDDGIAYRIITSFKDSVIIKNEVAEFCFPGKPSAWLGEIHKKSNADIFHTAFEETYALKEINQFSDTSLAFSPLLIMPESNPKIAITESDLEDYPGMFLGGTGSNKLKGVWAGYPLEEISDEGWFSELIVPRRADYIAKTTGNRSFPWRILMIAEQDKELPSNDMVYRLASPSRVKDVSWIKPGNITEEWIIGINLFNVPFKSGINTASYKYYIDFAQRFGFDRIMMDAGWSDNDDLFKVHPDINMDTLSAYARQKGIKIAMWTLARTLERQLDSALTQFNKWGVDFIMTDFIERDDQKAVNFHKRITEACADHQIMLMFHGSYPPKGFNRTYPHALTREAVLGSEHNMGSDKATPAHNILLTFTRMLAGPLDYEPGMLNNANKESFRAIPGFIMSAGTRCHQLAMVVVYDSPIQFFSGNPSQGLLQPDYMEFLGNIPTIWDQTIILDAKVAEYILTARKSEQDWYVAAMTDWTARDITLNFDFLDEGAAYNVEICKDGINADRYASDYQMDSFRVKKMNTMTIHLAPGGGFLMKLKKQ